MVNERNIVPLRYVCFESETYAASVKEVTGGGAGDGVALPTPTARATAAAAAAAAAASGQGSGKGAKAAKGKLIPKIDLQGMAAKVRAAKEIRAAIVGSIAYLLPLIELVGEDEFFSKLGSPIVSMNGIMYGSKIMTMEIPGRPREATMNRWVSRREGGGVGGWVGEKWHCCSVRTELYVAHVCLVPQLLGCAPYLTDPHSPP